jgi:hypothetical protein
MCVVAMMYAIVAIYTDFESEIVNAKGIEQAEGVTAGPKGNKLLFEVPESECRKSLVGVGNLRKVFSKHGIISAFQIHPHQANRSFLPC